MQPNIDSAAVPDQARIFGWIEEIVGQGIRRSGYSADRWTEQFLHDRFQALGMTNVRLEPVPTTCWEPHEWSLWVTGVDGDKAEIPCTPMPFCAPVDGLEVELAALDPDRPDTVAGRAALVDMPLLRGPALGALAVEALLAGQPLPDDLPMDRVLDRDETLRAEQVLPFARPFQEVTAAAESGGAVAVIGALTGYPGDSHEYYVPYDARLRPVPGVWVSGSSAIRLRELLLRGPVRIRLTVRATTSPVVAHNVVGELPGADEELLIVGSHHDGPWASAVEDASGIALVLAQAEYWAGQPQSSRPHRMVFLLQCAHMEAAAGMYRFIETHRDELDRRLVLEVHLEHVAKDFAERDGELVPTGLPSPRWWFTSRIPRLERAVHEALVAEDLQRSLILPPDAIGPRPTTDGAAYHDAGYPLVQLLAAPFYLFDAMDTLDKIDHDQLVPLTRAVIQIIASTHGIGAAALRAQTVEGRRGIG